MQSIEDIFQNLLEEERKQAITLRRMLELLSGKGLPMLTLLFALPFCQPIQIPGLSTPFGLILFFLGLRIGFGHRIWLPKKLLDHSVSRSVLEKVLTKSLWLFKKLKRFSHPRFLALSQASWMKPMNGLSISLMGIFLALPLPIPLTNLIAAWSIFFLSLGMIEDDGLAICIGHSIACITAFVFIYLVIISLRAVS